jgi:outer membrane protein
MTTMHSNTIPSRGSILRTFRKSALLVGSLLFFLNGPSLKAQTDTLFLSLADCIRMAQINGPPGAVARHAYEAKARRYDAFTATFYPQLSLRGDLPGYYRSINTIVLPDGTTSFTPQSLASSSLSLVLAQKIPFTGGELSFISGLNRIDLLDSHTQYYRSNPLTVTLSQPLFQINTMSWDREAELLRYQMAGRESAEAMEDVAIEVTNRFFDSYLALMNCINAGINLANNDTLFKISRGRFNVGRIAENDLLQSELAFLRAQTELENARLAYTRSHAALRIVLGVAASQEVVLLPPTNIPDIHADSSLAITEARRNRSDVLGLELRRLTAERSVSQARSDNLFNATLSASMGFNQRSPVLRDSYRDLLEQQEFTLRLDFPIFRWGAGSATIDAAIATRQETEVTVERQLRELDLETASQVSSLNLLRMQVDVAARADTMSGRRFDVAKERYLIGKIDIPNLFLAQSEKDNGRREHIQTLWNYWNAFFRVRRLTLYDFVTGQSLVKGE